MKINVGKADRMARIVAGGIIVAAGIYQQNWWGLIGAGLLLSGLLSRCPAYSVMRVNTISKH